MLDVLYYYFRSLFIELSGKKNEASSSSATTIAMTKATPNAFFLINIKTRSKSERHRCVYGGSKKHDARLREGIKFNILIGVEGRKRLFR